MARPDRRGPHRLYLPPAEDFAAGFVVRCDGATLGATRDTRTGVVEVDCGGSAGAHELTVEGR